MKTLVKVALIASLGFSGLTADIKECLSAAKEARKYTKEIMVSAKYNQKPSSFTVSMAKTYAIKTIAACDNNKDSQKLADSYKKIMKTLVKL